MRELKKRCGKVALYTFACERAPLEGVEVRYVGGKNEHSIRTNLKALASTGKLAGELARFDLLILAGPDTGVLPAVHRAKKLNPGLRLFWVYHSLTPPELLPSLKDRLLTRVRRWAYLRSMRRSDAVQTFSEFVRAELVSAGLDARLIRPMHFAIDTAAFASGSAAQIRNRHGLGDSFVLLYVGRLAPAKRVDRLISAMGMLDGNVALVIVGGGPEEESLKALAKTTGNKVIFAGRVPDGELPGYYAACDAWVTASEHEGFCVPIVEAMAAGKPVVVPDVAAMPETAGDAGLVYKSGDAAGLTRQLKRLMTDRAFYDRLSGVAKARAGSFDLGRNMGGYVDLILAGGKCKP